MSLPSPWCTRKEAAKYLRVSDDSIDRSLVEFRPSPVPNKFRFLQVPFGKRNPGIRIVSADVLNLLPDPEAQQKETNDPSTSS